MISSPAQTQTDAGAAGTRVLVIDDEEVVHASLRKILSRLKFGISAVLSAQEGLNKLERERFDLIVTDLMMPQMNGIELLQVLQGQGCTTPIIMITGYPTIRTAVQALRLGAMDYVAKPFTRKELLSPIKRALRIEDLTPPQTEPQSPSPTLEPGQIYGLPHHAWARYESDGTFLIGIDEGFLGAVGPVTGITPPEEVEMIEQGHVGLVLTNAAEEAHGVAMPLSGQVMETHDAVFDDPSQLTADKWMLRILPSHLDAELVLLLPRNA